MRLPEGGRKNMIEEHAVTMAIQAIEANVAEQTL